MGATTPRSLALPPSLLPGFKRTVWSIEHVEGICAFGIQNMCLGPGWILLEKALFIGTKVLKLSCGWPILVQLMGTGLFHCRIPDKGALWELCVKERAHKTAQTLTKVGPFKACPRPRQYRPRCCRAGHRRYTPIHPTDSDTAACHQL